MLASKSNAIFINGRFLTHNTTGVQRYAREVVSAMDRLLDRGECPAPLRDLDWHLLAPPGTVCDLDLKRIHFRQIGAGGGHLWEQLHLSRHASAGRLLSLANSGPVFHPRQIAVIHDAAVYKAAAGFGWRYRTFHRLMGHLLARTSAIATVSRFSRAELADALGIAAERITVAPNGADHFKSVSPDEGIVDRLQLAPEKYFVTVGLSSANKNIPLAMEAFHLLGREDSKLVVVGAGSARVAGKREIENREGVIFAGRLTDEEIAGLLRSAAAFLFPSRYEGFGMPPLEAMTQGCPVLASTARAVIEVCGGAALHFDPDDARTLARLMGQVLDDAHLRAELSSRGSLRPASYRWEAPAAELMRCLRDLKSNSRRFLAIAYPSPGDAAQLRKIPNE